MRVEDSVMERGLLDPLRLSGKVLVVVVPLLILVSSVTEVDKESSSMVLVCHKKRVRSRNRITKALLKGEEGAKDVHLLVDRFSGDRLSVFVFREIVDSDLQPRLCRRDRVIVLQIIEVKLDFINSIKERGKANIFKRGRCVLSLLSEAPWWVKARLRALRSKEQIENNAAIGRIRMRSC